MSALNSERWTQVWRAATGAIPPAAYHQRLMALYAEPHRHYHNHQHISDYLTEFDHTKLLAANPLAVELAIWFHDAVYDPRAADNEQRSAELAKEWLNQSSAVAPLVHSVEQLILATKHHEAALHADAALLVDVDLSILGRAPEIFWEYERQIRAEYSWVDPTVFAAKRAEILQRFLARERIYHTEPFFHRMEIPARANLRASVQRLSIGTAL